MSHTLHQQLVELRGQAEAWLEGEKPKDFRATDGICLNIKMDAEDNGALLALMAKWPGNSGAPGYPVPSPTPVRTAKEHYQYADCLQKWDPRHEYARNRWALLEWLIEQTASEADQ